MTIQLTNKQASAYQLLSGKAKHVLLYGGARSGKSVDICIKLIERAQAFPGSRHLIIRWRQAHAKNSIFRETLAPLVQGKAKINWSDPPVVFFPNGSEIWVGGLDDKERTEKLLGTEYVSMYFNEVSQIGYDSVILGRTRLAQKIAVVNEKTGKLRYLRPKAYYDCNPPSPLHWAHKLFIEKVDPKTNEPLPDPEQYAALQMNPKDNLDNLPGDFIQELSRLSEHARRRFLAGEWVRAEGLILYNFRDHMIVSPRELPRQKDIERWTVGVDFGKNMVAELFGWQGEKVWQWDEITGFNLTSSMINLEITRRWGRHINISYCDPSGGERIQEIYMGEKADNSVEPGLDYLNTLMEQDNFRVCTRCVEWLREVESYRRDDKERIIKEGDHAIDAGRYGTYSEHAGGIAVYVG